MAAPYNAANSGGSNLGPSNKALIDRVQGDVDKLKQETRRRRSDRSGDDVGQRARPGHLAGGRLLPGARVLPRRATWRKIALRQLVSDHIEGRFLGLLGEPRVNVLLLNLALDQLSAG